MAHPGMKNFKNGPSTTIVGLIVAFFIVGAIGIYYLFFDNPTWLYDQNEVEIALSEKHMKEFEEAKKKALLEKAEIKNDNENITDEPTNGQEKTNEQEKVDDKSVTKKKEVVEKVEDKSVDVKVVKEKKIEKVKELKKKKSVTIPKVAKPKTKPSQNNSSQKVRGNIFFDGTNYSVQISSWRDESTANREANRISKKGYNTFVMEAFIPKFNANWYRVRIGEIATLEEAQEIQRTVK